MKRTIQTKRAIRTFSAKESSDKSQTVSNVVTTDLNIRQLDPDIYGIFWNDIRLAPNEHTLSKTIITNMFREYLRAYLMRDNHILPYITVELNRAWKYFDSLAKECGQFINGLPMRLPVCRVASNDHGMSVNFYDLVLLFSTPYSDNLKYQALYLFKGKTRAGSFIESNPGCLISVDCKDVISQKYITKDEFHATLDHRIRKIVDETCQCIAADMETNIRISIEGNMYANGTLTDETDDD